VITFGGVAVDGELRVVREDGSPVPGLYAAGEALGAAATSGNGFCGGMLATPALSFGRILGRRLAVAAGAGAVAAP
jgi:predicted oxidoreductase